MHHNPQIDPIYKKGKKDAAVLLIHGFTGTPDAMRPLANHLHGLGFTVSAPLLDGHGTTKENLARSNAETWYQSSRQAFLTLQEQHSKVFVAGLSLGGVLALKLAQEYPQVIHGLSCLATPIHLHTWVRMAMPFVRYTPLKYLYSYQKKARLDVKDPLVVKNYWHVKEMPVNCIQSLMDLQEEVRNGLTKVISPTLIIHSRYDSTAPYESMNYICKHISAPVTETITLENSYHLITVDYEKDRVSEKTGEFFSRFA